MDTESRTKNRAILAALAVQIVALAALALLETLVGGNRLRIWVAFQVIWPIWLTLEALYQWSKTPALGEIAWMINGLYGFMFGLGIAANAVAAVYSPSTLVYGRTVLAAILAATYLFIAYLLMPPFRLRPPDDEVGENIA